MISLSKSFVLGVLVASVTWTISLLLYYNLTQSDDRESVAASSAALHGFSQQQRITHAPNVRAELTIHPVDNVVEAAADQHKKYDGSSRDLYLEKLRRLKKEKSRRKISQHLVDELRPRPVEILGNGMSNFNENSLGLTFNISLQTSLVWCATPKTSTSGTVDTSSTPSTCWSAGTLVCLGPFPTRATSCVRCNSTRHIYHPRPLSFASTTSTWPLCCDRSTRSCSVRRPCNCTRSFSLTTVVSWSTLGCRSSSSSTPSM